MATRKALVQIAGVINELPAGDSLDGVTGGSEPSNVVSSTSTVAADTSRVIVSYLQVESTLNVSGNLLITG